MADVFLSYSREDQATARRFAEGLEREGFQVWWDQALDAGDAFDRATEKALDEARAVVVLWSKHAVQSNWVRAEATQAQASHRLVPVMIEPCRRPIMFELTQTADLSGWQGDATDERWHAFIGGLRRFLGRSGGQATGTWSAAIGEIPAPAAASPPPPARRGLPFWAAAAAAVVAVAAGAFWLLQGRQAGPAAAREISIAVLPFSDMSPAKDQAYFADGVSEEILNSLARIPDRHLKVISRNSSFVFRDARNLKEVGTTLDVDHVLEGSVRKSGDQLRITAQLINTDTDAHLWSKTYDRPLADIFSVQEEIARSVAEALQVKLGVGLGRQPGMTRDIEAYELFLEALPLQVLFTPESRRRLIGLLERAVARDPSFAVAWDFLSLAYAAMPTFVAGDAGEWQRKSEVAFGEFRRLLPDSPDVHFRLAQRARVAGQIKQAAAHMRDAEAAAAKLGVRFEPGPPGMVLRDIGLTRAGIARLEQDKARDPLNPEHAFWLAHAYGEGGNFPAAFAEVERGYALGGTWQYLMASVGIMTALGARDRDRLVHWLEVQTTIAPDADARAANARLLAGLDKPAESLAELQVQARNPASTVLELSAIAPWLAWYGDSAGALEALRTGRQRDRGVSSLWSAVYGDVRKLPGFKELVREEGLIDVWRGDLGWGDHCKPLGDADFECS